jgi:hypothetical protein
LSGLLNEESRTDTPQSEAPVETQASEPTPALERPEWLPEKYKSPEDLAKAYKELESKLGKKDADLRAEIEKQIQESAYADRPADKGDYQLPDIVDESMAVDNELLSWWADHAFESGLSQEEFAKGIEVYAQAMQASMPDLSAERGKLGDNANDRIQSASAFASKFFPEQAMPAIERMCETHEGIIALEAIMEAVRDNGYAEPTTVPGRLDEATLQQMMKDERYWNPRDRDPSFVRQVEEGFRKLYG